MSFLTPDAATGAGETCYMLRFPDTTGYRALVDGALAALVFESSWEEHGTETIQETAQNFKRMLLSAEHRCMIGSVIPMAREIVPDWALPCNGETYNREDYPKLWELINAVYKTGDTFTVPNLINRTVVGAKVAGEGAFDFDERGGEIDHTMTASEMPSHFHTSQPHNHFDYGHQHFYNSPGITIPVVAPGEAPVTAPNFLGGQTITGYANISSAVVDIDPSGADEPHNNMPPFVALTWVIVAR